eukprot:2740972-Pyramimonas_sp.AAC.1
MMMHARSRRARFSQSPLFRGVRGVGPKTRTAVSPGTFCTTSPAPGRAGPGPAPATWCTPAWTRSMTS